MRPQNGNRGRPYVVVSADTHAAPSTFEQYLSYVEPKHRQAIEAMGAMDLGLAHSEFGTVDPEILEHPDLIRVAAASKAGGLAVDTTATSAWLDRYSSTTMFVDDADGKRLQALEDQGVHAEVTYPGAHLGGFLSLAMYGGASHGGPPLPRTTVAPGAWRESEVDELLWPALHAYNLWLADFCSAAPGRRAGVMQVDLHDMDRAVEEIRWARNAGIFGGVSLPPMSIESGLRGYSDDYYEPFWSACEDTGMVVSIHTGAPTTDAKYLYDSKRGRLIASYEVFTFSRRPLVFMIIGGVFDRHPRLRVVVAENFLQWYPALMREMDVFFNTHAGSPIRSSLKMRPSEYFEEHIFLGGSLMQRNEAEMRNEIGVGKMMWGSDYPHLEGAAPVNRLVMQYVLGGLPEDDIRRILGQNAIELWGFDADLLGSVADRVGPTVEDLSTRLALDEIPETFSWSLQRQPPVQASMASA